MSHAPATLLPMALSLLAPLASQRPLPAPPAPRPLEKTGGTMFDCMLASVDDRSVPADDDASIFMIRLQTDW